jgi:hypothetical protein
MFRNGKTKHSKGLPYLRQRVDRRIWRCRLCCDGCTSGWPSCCARARPLSILRTGARCVAPGQLGCRLPCTYRWICGRRGRNVVA